MAAEVTENYQKEMDNMQFSSAPYPKHGASFLARTNTSMRPLHGSWRRTSPSKRSWEALWRIWLKPCASSASSLSPFMTQVPFRMYEQLGLDFEKQGAWENVAFGTFPADVKAVVEKGTPIFPRLVTEEEVAYIKEQMGGGTIPAEEETVTAEWDPTTTVLTSEKEKQIKYEDFDKVELKVAEVIDCQKVEGADKLLKFRLDAGDEGHRQILSGIAQWYPDPAYFIGKKVIIVANLKARKMKGEISQGMILSAEKDGVLQVILHLNRQQMVQQWHKGFCDSRSLGQLSRTPLSILDAEESGQA